MEVICGPLDQGATREVGCSKRPGGSGFATWSGLVQIAYGVLGHLCAVLERTQTKWPASREGELDNEGLEVKSAGGTHCRTKLGICQEEIVVVGPSLGALEAGRGFDDFLLGGYG